VRVRSTASITLDADEAAVAGVGGLGGGWELAGSPSGLLHHQLSGEKD
jgi:hypothetical protein